MKSVLISINPKWCEKIASGKKTVEVRKTRPKLETLFKCYIYQTKTQWAFEFLRRIGLDEIADILSRSFGKVIGEFVCDCIDFWRFDIHDYDTTTLEELAQVSCVKEDDLLKYADLGSLYGWHISDLVIYDRPRELSEFGLKRPPQSWCYVKEGR